MRSFWLYILRISFNLIPETRCFSFKSWILRRAGAVVGKNVKICSSAMIIGAGRLEIGDNTWIGHQCIISATSSVKIGKNCDLAPRVYIGNGTHQITPERERIADIELSQDIEIGNGCWLCVNSTILPGVVLGEKCVVAAGAVVTKSADNMSFIAGVPAVVKRTL